MIERMAGRNPNQRSLADLARAASERTKSAMARTDELRQRVALAISPELRHTLKELRRDLQHDQLTGLLSARQFKHDTMRLIADYLRSGHNATMIYIDVDNFKSFNDKYGHSYGDIVLKSIASILVENARISDGVYRAGAKGDEMIVLLSETDFEHAASFAKRIEADVESYKLKIDCDIKLGISTGVYSLSQVLGAKPMATKTDMSGTYETIAEVWTQHADAKMYDSKLRRKGIVLGDGSD